MAKSKRRQSEDSDVKLFQQGDVLLFTTNKIPLGVTGRSDGILAHGELTGHAHRLANASDGLLYEAEDGTLYLRVGAGGASITHEEHAPLTLPPGTYKIGRVREYDHFAEEARRVRD